MIDERHGAMLEKFSNTFKLDFNMVKLLYRKAVEAQGQIIDNPSGAFVKIDPHGLLVLGFEILHETQVGQEIRATWRNPGLAIE